MLNPFGKSIERPGNSLAYNLSLLISLFFKIAINTRDGDLRFNFRLCAVVFLYYDSEVGPRLFKVLLRQIVNSRHELGFRLRPIQRAGAVAMALEKASWCVDNFWDFLKLSLP